MARMGGMTSVLAFVGIGSCLSVRSFSRVSGGTSVLDYLAVGSNVSLRGFARIGSGLSLYTSNVHNKSVISSKTSCLDALTLGSSLSMRSFARCRGRVSVVNHTHIGSTMSVRGFTRIGSGASCIGLMRFGSAYSASVINFCHLGSSLSVRSSSRVSGRCSVLDRFHCGSTMSCRSFARVGSGLSINGGLRMGGRIAGAPHGGASLVSHLHLGSSMSIRSCGIFRGRVSMMSEVALGSSLSIRHYARLGSGFSVGSGSARMKRNFMNGMVSCFDCSTFGSTMSLRAFARTGSAVSIFDFVTIASAVSIRSYVRAGSALSVRDRISAGSRGDFPSVINFVNFGSTMSVRCHARVGTSFSVYDAVFLGSAVSVRQFCRIGSGCSLFRGARIGGKCSVLDSFHLASSLSTRSWARFGDMMSVCDFVSMGSAVSTRAFAMLGSALSVYGQIKCNNRCSIGGVTSLGSSLSIRSFARAGSATSLLAFVHIGSSISVRSFSRLGNQASVIDFVNVSSGMSIRSFTRLGSSVSVAGAAVWVGKALIASAPRTFGAGSYSATDDYTGTPTHANPQLNIWADKTSATTTSQRSLSMFDNGSAGTANYGGTLHGTWQSDVTVSASDRRLKYDVLPLFKTIVSQHKKRQEGADELSDDFGSRKKNVGTAVGKARLVETMESALQNAADVEKDQNEVMSSIIRQIRPVSFRYKKQSEAKYSRYGFIAQELESVLPSVVYTDKAGMKSVNYNDMIAVIALGLQSVESRVSKLDKEVDMVIAKQDTYYLDLSDRMKVLSTMFNKVLTQDADGSIISIGGLAGAKLDEQARAAMEKAAAVGGVTGNSTSLIEGSGVEDQLAHARKPTVESMLEPQASDDKVARQVKALVKRIDFQSDAWLKKPQAAKQKLAEKLAAYQIDLSELIRERTNGTDTSLVGASTYKVEAVPRSVDLADPQAVQPTKVKGDKSEAIYA